MRYNPYGKGGHREAGKCGEFFVTGGRGRLLRRIGGKKPFQEGSGKAALLKVGIIKDTAMERECRFDSFHDAFIKGSPHARERFLTVDPMNDQLGNQ